MPIFSWNIGRVAGIDLYLHPTFLWLLVFVALFQGGVPAALLVAAVFGCVLLHELGHALAARLYGIATHDITLYPIGGVARLARLPRKPGPELLIALAGPAVNLAIAGALAVVVGLAAAGGREGGLVAFLDALLSINLALAAFNLIPAFPMDGGRVLRAALTSWVGRLRATEIAGAGPGARRRLRGVLPAGRVLAPGAAGRVRLPGGAGGAGAGPRRGAPAAGPARLVRRLRPPARRALGARRPRPVAHGAGRRDGGRPAVLPAMSGGGGLTPLVELGVAEAHALLTGRFGQADLPPLDAIENEDWGRDYLLARLQDLTDADLAAAGLCRTEPAPDAEGDPGAATAAP